MQLELGALVTNRSEVHGENRCINLGTTFINKPLIFFYYYYLYIGHAPLLSVVLHALLQFIYICSRVISTVHCLLVTLLHIVKVYRFNTHLVSFQNTIQVQKFNFSGHTVRLFGQKKEGGRKTGGAPLLLPKIRKNPLIEIIPINTGCLNQCTYCKTKHARGELGSYPPGMWTFRTVFFLFC